MKDRRAFVFVLIAITVCACCNPAIVFPGEVAANMFPKEPVQHPDVSAYATGENRFLQILKGERPLYEPKSFPPDSLSCAFLGGKPILDFRYRFETVNRDNFDNDAQASTLRVDLGYETGKFYNFSALVSFRGVFSIGPEDYNSTVNGKTGIPAIPDPSTNRLQEGLVAYDGIPATRIKAGRQGIKLDNERFVSIVDFRQLGQTFDSVRVINQSLPHTWATYAYVWQVNRALGKESPFGTFDTNVHLFNAAYHGFPYGSVVGYAYLLDIRNFDSLSTNTIGVRFSGEHGLGVKRNLKFVYNAEYANQSNAAKNPNDYRLHYFHLTPGVSWHGFVANLGWEYLEGDGVNAFQTPLATLHKFNGWADQFLITPPNGLADSYVSLTYGFAGFGFLQGTTLSVVYHDFKAVKTSGDYGREWDLKIDKIFYKRYTLSVNYADYRARDFAVDTKKMWLTLSVRF
jgi:hypothetical protein